MEVCALVSYVIGMSDFSALLSPWFCVGSVMGFGRFCEVLRSQNRQWRGKRGGRGEYHVTDVDSRFMLRFLWIWMSFFVIDPWMRG